MKGASRNMALRCFLQSCTVADSHIDIECAAQVLPRLAALLADWQPLQEPERGRAEFAGARPLLESDAQRDAIFQARGIPTSFA